MKSADNIIVMPVHSAERSGAVHLNAPASHWKRPRQLLALRYLVSAGANSSQS